jgi:hypothetical protein
MSTLGEDIFVENWIEQFRRNKHERPFYDVSGMSDYDAACDRGVNCFSWYDTPEGMDVWSERDANHR